MYVQLYAYNYIGHPTCTVPNSLISDCINIVGVTSLDYVLLYTVTVHDDFAIAQLIGSTRHTYGSYLKLFYSFV